MSLRMQAVTKRYGDNTIFEDLSLVISGGEKVALIGANGSGKSTLLRLAAGIEAPDSGTVSVRGRVSLLEQHTPTGAASVAEGLAPTHLAAAQAELSSAEAALADPTDENLARFAAAEERFRELGGYDFSALAHATLDALGLAPDQPLSSLSGGQQRRVLLARQLLAQADVVLLDEPTNHLDTAGTQWLEEWIMASRATVLVVSHDRAFLDATVSKVAELERGRLSVWPGNYSQAKELKVTAQAAQQRRHDAQARRKQQLAAEAARLGSTSRSAGKFNHKRVGNQPLLPAKNRAESVSRTMARRASALEKRIEQMDVVEAPFRDNATVSVPLPEVPAGPGDLLRFEAVTVERGGRTLVSGLDLLLRRGEKLALVGPNGSGKSSLIELALGKLDATSGKVVRAAGLATYVASQGGEELLEFPTAEAALRDAQPAIRQQDVHYVLARTGVTNDPSVPVSELSGGQRTRLALARLSVTRAPLLVLDEPTNHLDIAMVEALERTLRDYPGTILMATHDRQLIKAVATRTLVLGGAQAEHGPSL